MKSECITIRLSTDLRRRLKATARAHGAREADVIRAVLEQRLDAEPTSAYERAKKAGIIGVLKDAPADLSTNPKYFEGFGES